MKTLFFTMTNKTPRVYAPLLSAALACAALLCAALPFAACEQMPPEQPASAQTPAAPAPREAPEDAIPIATAEDLKNIGKAAAGLPLNRPYVLTADITVSGWTPIANGTKPFTGAFYGDGRTITITSGTGGLFGSLKEAAVYDLTVNITAAKTGGALGGIAGTVTKSWIEDCTVTAALTMTATGHNNSAGGIAGTMGNYAVVRNCTASGTITLTAPMTGADASSTLMVYAGGIAGYSGTPGLAGDGVSGCLIEGSSWSGAVSAASGYPYAGGIVGYNYTGAMVKRCSSSGTVTASGGNLPYAGGVAGYNSGYAQSVETPSRIENSYSTATVKAVSTSRAALAGGIAGANAAGAVITRCYAAGAVTASVDASGAANLGGSIGVMTAANAGGIAGAQYVTRTVPPAIEDCAALNSSITGASGTSGAAWNIYRIAGAGDTGSDTGTLTNNAAWSGLPVPNHAEAWDKSANGKDGADCEQHPAQSAYTALGWDFSGVWQMSGAYPALR